jgi:phytoene dehydrogenase-like protein
MTAYDGIILGGGHNSLILQAYLGRAGLRTICLEQADHTGGGLSTVPFPPGSDFLHNVHSFYHRGLTSLPWYRDLDLLRLGATYLQPELNVAMLCRDGRSLQWWSDFDRTVTSFAGFSQRDAEALQRWREAFLPIVRSILIPEAQHPPLPPALREQLLGKSAGGRLLLETSRMSPLEFVNREFEHPAVRAALLFFNGLREVDLRMSGFGHHIPALLASDAMAQMCVGGSQQLADALVRAVEQSGGRVQTSTRPTRILVEYDRVVGVETNTGEVVRATKFVASGLNPQQTFVELIDDRFLPAKWLAQARDFRYNILAPLFALNVNLREPPRYLTESPGELDQAFMVILGLEDGGQFQGIVDHHERGEIPPTVMWGTCPTRFDPTQAPEGSHTAFMWEKLPYRLDGDAANWDARGNEHGHQLLAMWSRYAPNLADAVIGQMTRSPLDVERTLPNMRFGDLLVGSFEHGQIGYHRPFPGAGHYRGHLPGLYLCGSSCHPGGNITGLPGYNCAQVLLNDLGIQSDWMPQPLTSHLDQLV